MTPKLALGLMSGTSMDGIDVALLETDGERHVRPRGGRSFSYPAAVRKRLEAAVRQVEPPDDEVQALARTLTALHARAARRLLTELALSPAAVDLVGFPGHTLRHRPERGETVQLGDGALLAQILGLPVVWDFRSEDVRRGGQGAPLVPVYHAALATAVAKPTAFLNLGGIANLTWVGPQDRLMAFDVAPCNALLDDWMRRHGAGAWDEGGRLTRMGRADHARIHHLLAHPFFRRPPPRSLDRLSFDLTWLEGLTLADGLATAAWQVAEATARALAFLPAWPKRLHLTGGGRHNAGLVAALAARLPLPVVAIETLGHDGDLLEAEAFAFLAVRVWRGLPTSFPETTGVAVPTCGGRIHRPVGTG